MGVLDEAIRDHLELRRRHGASEAELARAEAEALGPARRDPAAGLFTDDESGAGDDQTTILDPVVEEEVGRAVEDQLPPADPTGEPEGATALYDMEREFQAPSAPERDVEELSVEEAPVDGMRVEDEPPIDGPPVETDEPAVQDAPIEEPPPVEEEPPVDDEPPPDDEPRGEQTRVRPPTPIDEPEDDEPPPPALPRPYSDS